MSKDETGSDEVRGLPGYPANNSIPSGFALPIPMAPAPEHLDEPEPADPWSSTWEDTSWHVDAVTDEGTNDAPVTDGSGLAAAGSEGADGNESADGTDWTDSYEFGGEYAADYGQLARHDDSAAGATGGTSGINGHSTTEPATSWESWASPGDSTEGDTHVSTSHWADRQHDAEVSDASQEEYSGWTPAGYASDDVSPTIDSTDHTAAQQAYAARPAVDPDVAAASAEADHDTTRRPTTSPRPPAAAAPTGRAPRTSSRPAPRASARSSRPTRGCARPSASARASRSCSSATASTASPDRSTAARRSWSSTPRVAAARRSSR